MNTSFSKVAKHVGVALAASATTTLLYAPLANAQDSNADAAVEKIAVVGTRAAPRSVGDSPVPVDIIGAEEFRAQGSTDITSMMQAVVPSLNVNDQPINDASTLVRPANLRGLAPDHTLILVNGKRRHRSAVITFLGGQISDGAQGPDISTIPAIALKQIEVLRDGAAAQYGSDAIAGVVNFALKDDSEGGSIEFMGGEYFEGDGDTYQVAFNKGFSLGDNAFANLSVETRVADPTSRSIQRDDAAALAAAGNQYVLDPAQVWGSPEIKDDTKIFLNMGFDLYDDVEGYLFTGFAKREVEGGFYYRNPHNRGGVNDGGVGSNGEQLLLIGDVTSDMSGNCPTIVVGDNVLQSERYINEVANNPDCWAFNEMFPGGFTPKFGGEVEDFSIVSGARGEIDNDTNFDVSVSYGSNSIDYAISNTINPSLGPDSPNSFKPGKYIQTEAAINADVTRIVSDELFVAGGFEYRYESFEAKAGDPASYAVGPLAAQGFGIGSNGFPGLSDRFEGKNSRNSVALYVDSEYFVSDDFMIGAALRYEDFTDFGNTTKGKLSARYQLNDEVAVRGAIATGFKAPTIGQSNVRNVTTAFATVNGETRLVDRATLPPTDPISLQKGATPLQPEESTSYSFGVVAEFDNGLFLTVDYFNIELDDRLSTTSGIALSQADIDALTAQGVPDASSFSQVSYFTNDFSTSTQGIDVVANYSTEIFDGETLFSLAANWTDTEVEDVKTFTIDSNSFTNISDTRIRMLEENLPDTRWTLTANHEQGDMRYLARLNYFAGIFEDHLDAGIPIEGIGAEFTVDLEVSYQYSDNINVAVGAKNAFDNFPDRNVDFDNEVVGSLYPTTSPIGINGGFYYIKASYTF